MARRKESADEHQKNGTFRADRHSAAPETIGILKVLPPSPLPLADDAQEIYLKTGQTLIDAEFLKETDLNTLAQYATEVATYSRAMKELNAGEMVVELHNKVTAPNHYRKIATEAGKLVIALGDRLGLNPRSRYGLKGSAAFGEEGAVKRADPLAFLNEN